MRRRRILTTAATVVLALTLGACSSRDVPVSATVLGSQSETTTNSAVSLGIPPGHLPPPGQCRIWVPGRPPGHQPPPGGCSSLATRVPSDAWLVHTPGRDGPGRGNRGGGKAHIRVTVFGDTGPQLVRYFERASGKLIREERPGR